MLLVHVATSGRYGWFRDELYFVACGHHLAWGYVDQPPLVALVARACSSVGHSLYLFRLPAALAHAGLVLLTALAARRMGGGAFAQALAALATAVAPILLLFGHLLTMNAFEPLVVARRGAGGARARRRRRRALVDRSAARIIGVGLLDKHSVAFFAVALVVGLLATPARRRLASRWFAAAMALAALIVLPHVAWQVGHGWPMLELLRNGQDYKNEPVSPWQFFVAQLRAPASAGGAGVDARAVAAVARAARCGRSASRRVVVAALVLALHGKIYYLASLYPLLFAAGGVALESLLARAWLRALALGALAAGGVATLPLALPMLPVPALLALSGGAALRAAAHRAARLSAAVAAVRRRARLARARGGGGARLSRAAARRAAARAAIFARNYGEAGALDFFGARDGLPPATTGHNGYWMWGPPARRRPHRRRRARARSTPTTSTTCAKRRACRRTRG